MKKEYFYEVSLLKSPLSPLTYKSEHKIDTGVLVFVNLNNRKKPSEAVVLKLVEKPDFKCSEIFEITQYYFDEKMMQTAEFISKYYICSFGEALGVFTPYDKLIKEHEKIKNKIQSNIELSIKQQEAFDFLNKNRSSLLFAETGSGKTEIYIKTIEKYINDDKEALLLMPEISLTPQMNKRLQKVFGESIAIWHSKVTKAKKKKIIQGLLKGEIKVIAGARSALFLPFNDLGVIVVDEEHDESYKSDSKPRLNAKDISLYIGKKYNIQVVLGSATPSLGSFKKVPYIRIDETYFDTKKEIIFDESSDNLNDTILNKIHEKLSRNEQVIVFLPTRANFKYQICSDCGKSVECPFCSVSMSLHKNSLALKCHYCGYMQSIPKSCPSCKTGIIHNLRVGTAQIEEELQNIFSDRVVKRFDTDSITTEKKLKEILKEFNDNKIDILVGTQMLTKGHDYHNVTLVIVLGIDSILNMDSYKAREKALSLLKQTAGRSGRKGFGEVLVQTQNKDFFEHYLINGNYENFLNDELEFREGLYPPYVRLARVVFAHANASKSRQQMEIELQKLQLNSDIEVIGYGESKVFKIANRYRYEILLRAKNATELLKALHMIKSPNVAIDMDTLY